MNNFWSFLERIGRALTWWLIVAPWEEAIRVRTIPFAKTLRRRPMKLVRLGAGIHPKIPIIDTVYKQSVRLRTVGLPVQTLTTSDGATLTLSAVIGYSITDLEKLYRTLHHAEDTIRNKALGAIAQFIQSHSKDECSPLAIAEGTCASISLADYGLRCEHMELTDFCYVRTHRFIMDTKWGAAGDYLNTTTPTTSGGPS